MQHYYGQVTGLVYRSVLEYIGNMTSLVSCAGASLFSSPCEHSRDAGVMCQRRQGKLRLCMIMMGNLLG